MIFTNGDNDTLPLWFIQEVKGFRKDVRVVNLSLLNTPWYIWQLKHLEPKVPIRFTDEEIARLRPYRDKSGKIMMVKDLATKEIIEANNGRKPVYFAVTVADYMGYDRRLKLEGLAFRLVPVEGQRQIDVDKTLYNLYHTYSYRGLLRPAGGEQLVQAPVLTDRPEPVAFGDIDFDAKYVHDESVFKDVNTERLVTNYSAAHLRLCLHFLEAGEYQKAVRELERAVEISPGYVGYKDIAVATYGFAGQVAKAESLAYQFIAREPRSINLYMQLFRVYRRFERHDAAEAILIRLVNALPDNPDGYSLLTSFYEEQGDHQKAVGVVGKWLSLHPGDRAARNLLESLQEKATGEGQ